MTCWAKALGNCWGEITGEHVITEKLLGKRVELSGYLRPWFRGNVVEIPVRHLKQSILCEYHNRVLGRYADRAAIDFRRALRRSRNPNRLRGSHILRPPVLSNVPGVGIAKWLCKTHCNFMTIRGLQPAPDYIYYAFGHTTYYRIYFYAVAHEDEEVTFDNPMQAMVHYGRLQLPDFPEFDAFTLSLSGFRWAVSPVPLTLKVATALRTIEMLDRPRVLRFPTLLGPYEININWDSEPAFRKDIASQPSQEPDSAIVFPSAKLHLHRKD
jgi:hypothetical protein